jgi:hypothetical protein
MEHKPINLKKRGGNKMDHKSKMAVLEGLRRDAGNEAKGSEYIANNKRDWDPGYLKNMRQTAKNNSEQWELFSRLIALEGELEALDVSRVENKSEGNESKVVAAVDEVPVKTGDEKQITLMMGHVLTNDPCAICGGRCDPGGLDYVAKGTGRLVCDDCAKKYAPEMVEIQKAALSYAERDVSLTRYDIREKIRDAIDEPVEKRVMKVLDEICKKDEEDEKQRMIDDFN